MGNHAGKILKLLKLIIIMNKLQRLSLRMLKYINRSTAQAIGVGENPLNGSGEYLERDKDIV